MTTRAQARHCWEPRMRAHLAHADALIALPPPATWAEATRRYYAIRIALDAAQRVKTDGLDWERECAS